MGKMNPKTLKNLKNLGKYGPIAVKTVIETGKAIIKSGRDILDRRGRKYSFHSKRLLEEADKVCGVARAIKLLVDDKPVEPSIRQQASLLWRESTASILNVWEANAWVLDKRKKARPMRERFRSAVENLRVAAVKWHAEDAKWRESGGAAESDQAKARDKTARRVRKTFEAFLAEFQALHNVVQPLVREYTSPPDEGTKQ